MWSAANCCYEGKTILFHTDKGLKVPVLSTDITRSVICQNEEILALNSNSSVPTDSENNPRKGPFDDIRRRYPKIVEEDVTYEGDWLNGKRDGLGKVTWKDESTYIGEFQCDNIKGFGKLSRSDGPVYVGNWNNLKAEGLGMYTSKNGGSYEGSWLNDRQHGYGGEIWKIGACYEGDYIEGNKQGIGILTFDENSGYEGEFFMGNLEGIGTFVFTDKRKYEGEWKNNKMHGIGTITWPNGNYFEGHFFEDKKEGFGVFYSSTKVYLGFWRNSKLDGEIIILEKGKMKKQYWEEGRKIKNIPQEQFVSIENVAYRILEKLSETE